MKLGFITPTPHLEDFAVKSKFHLTLTHQVLDDDKYASFYSNRSLGGDYIVLDNSAFEKGFPMSTKDIYSAYMKIRPSEVVCPDVLQDGKATCESTSQFKKEFTSLINNPKFYNNAVSFMGVAQGKDLDDYLDCWDYLNNTVDTIGLSFIGIEKVLPHSSYTFARLMMLDILNKKGLLKEKPIHILGIGDNPLEIKIIQESPFSKYIRSNDSSSAFVHGSKGIRLDNKMGLPITKIKDKLDFKCYLPTKSYAYESVLHNIKIMQQWTNNMTIPTWI